MGPRCETIGKYVLPIFRSLVAKELVKTYDLTQQEAAKKLGTTQAAVSQYINSKRAFKGAQHLEVIMPKIQAIASETAKRLSGNEIGADEVTLDFCRLCSAFGEDIKGSSVCTIASLFSDYSI
jgi:predicted transcriptional regulator